MSIFTEAAEEAGAIPVAELLERALDALKECRLYLDRVEGEGEGGISDFDVASEACRAVLSDAEDENYILHLQDKVSKVGAVIDEATFLRDRISEMEWVDDEVFRQFDGHVSPSISRLKDALTALDGEKNDG